ncbi:MAG: hypothetical protein IPK82_34025 [Polyangiaceae bacterium]|nr:hypothetical protein [Polyangiaceae bacterium]
MPAFAGPLVGLSIGALLSRWGRASQGFSRAAALLLFGVIVFAPACAYPLLFFPDWAFAYWVDAKHIPSAFTLALLLIDALAPAVGYFLARRALDREVVGENVPAHTAALALIVVPAGIALVLSIAFFPSLATVGTRAMVRGDFGAEPLWRSALGFGLVWLLACIGIGAWRTALALSERGPKAPGAPLDADQKPAPALPKAYLGARTKTAGK